MEIETGQQIRQGPPGRHRHVLGGLLERLRAVRRERVVMQCVILAGGLGTRMRPWTEKTPKTLLPVGDIPFAHYQLSWLAGHGVTRVVYSIAVLGEQVRDFVGDGRRWGLVVDYVE